jgi:hypothetical protein
MLCPDARPKTWMTLTHPILSMETNTPYIHRLGVAGLPRACRPRALQASHALPVTRTPGSASVALHCSPPVCRASLTHIAHAPISTKRAIYHDSHASSAARPTHTLFLFFGPVDHYMLLQISSQNHLCAIGLQNQFRFCHPRHFQHISFLSKWPQCPQVHLQPLSSRGLPWLWRGRGLSRARKPRWWGSSSTAPAVGQTGLVAPVQRAPALATTVARRSSLALAIHDNEMELVHGCHKGGARAGPCLPWRPGKSSPVAQASSYG